MQKLINYKDVALKHGYSQVKTRDDVDITVVANGLRLNSPVILANMPSVQNEKVLATFKANNWPYVYHRLGGAADILRFVRKINEENWPLKSISVGVKDADLCLLELIKSHGLKLDWITIDVALIYNKHHAEFISKVRRMFPDVYLIAGNGYTKDVADWLSCLGINCFKTNVGVSSLCKSREFTGFGSGTISDLIEVCESNIDIIADGGLTILDPLMGEIAYGDIFKALNVGAKWVMSSSLFRWCPELSKNGVSTLHYGNSTALAKGEARHEEGGEHHCITNGVTVEQQMRKIREHLQSSVSYAGITSLREAKGSCEMRLTHG